jgi:hypothetical protein
MTAEGDRFFQKDDGIKANKIRSLIHVEISAEVLISE